ncbi:MAG: zinc ribbon domain-containing protein [Terracidiphilus sp.]|jgi:DNA-directed RNA polymerase subunit RPC12/RpoP
MQANCSKCGAQLEPAWTFCPHCGAASKVEVPAETQAETPTETPVETQAKIEPEAHESSPVPGALTGLLFGMLAVPILAIVGTMLCLTGLGAILGIPMILAAFFAPLLGPMIGLGALKGKCPWCGISVSSVANKKDFDCHACGQRIAIQHRAFVRAA